MTRIRQFAKAIAAFVGGLTPAAVVALLALFGVHLSVEVVAPILGALSPLLAALGAYRVENSQPTTDDPAQKE